MNITLQGELIKNNQESHMALSSISNTTATANQANLQKSGTTSEQSENGRTGHQSDNDVTGNKFNDNVTLNEPIVTPNSEESNVLDTTSAGNLLKNLMPTIMSNSDTAISAQANLSPQVAQALLAD
jgi:hypothetical protein